MKQILHVVKSSYGCQIRVVLLPLIFMMLSNASVAQTVTIEILDDNFEIELFNLGYDTDGLNNNNSVTVPNISAVTTLDLNSKGISSLTGIQSFTSLQTLFCRNNSLAGTLDLRTLTNLTQVWLFNNQLAQVNVTGLINLQLLELWNNNLISVDVSTNTALNYLDCDDNQFTSLDVSNLSALTNFYCSQNLLSTLDIRGLSIPAEAERFSCIDNPSLGCIFVDSLPASPNWLKDASATFCIDESTYSGTAWSPSAPTANSVAVISSNYSQVANITARSLRITNNAVVSIPSGTNVTLRRALVVEPGSSFTLSNNSNLTQSGSSAINSGIINVNRNSNSLFRLDFTLWSSPVNGSQTMADFSPLTSTNRFYSYSAANVQYQLVPSSNLFALATGYLIRMPNEGSSAYNAGSEALIYNGVFTGVPNNGNISVTGLTSNTYNAVGNPYPSTISAQQFLDGNSTDGVLYFWRKTNAAGGSSYATFTSGGATTTTPTSAAPDGTIAVGQGFIVRTGVGATSLNFNNAMRTTNNSAQFFKTKKPVEKSRIWLNLTGASGVFSQVLIAYMDTATQGVDKGIDGKYINDSPVALTSIIDNEEYVIQGRPTFIESDVVALSFKTNVAGTYTIAIDHVEGLFSTGQDVYLVDNKTGAETNLKSGSYNFTSDAIAVNNRFYLKYQKTLGVDTAELNNDSVQVYKANGILYVNAGAKEINSIAIYDIQGRLILENKNVKSNTISFNNLENNNQVLIVKVKGNDNSEVTKKVLN